MVTSSANDGPRREPHGPGARLVENPILRHDPAVETDALGGVGVQKVAGHQQLGRAAEPDDARQQPGGSHVGARQADLGEQEGDLRGLGAAIRTSQAAAITAPAPATVPFSAATIGRRQAIIDRMSAPVARVNSSRPRASVSKSLPMIASTSPPEQKARPAPVSRMARTPGSVSRASNVVLSSS